MARTSRCLFRQGPLSPKVRANEPLLLQRGAPASRRPCHASCGTPLQAWRRFPSAMPICTACKMAGQNRNAETQSAQRTSQRGRVICDWLLGKRMKKRLLLRFTIHDLQSYMIRVHSRGLNISERVGAAGPHRPTGERDKTSRSKIQEKKSDLHLSHAPPNNP